MLGVFEATSWWRWRTCCAATPALTTCSSACSSSRVRGRAGSGCGGHGRRREVCRAVAGGSPLPARRGGHQRPGAGLLAADGFRADGGDQAVPLRLPRVDHPTLRAGPARPDRAFYPRLMDLLESLVERQIREAQERGEFENLPGAGKPLRGLGGADDPDWWVKQTDAARGPGHGGRAATGHGAAQGGGRFSAVPARPAHRGVGARGSRGLQPAREARPPAPGCRPVPADAGAHRRCGRADRPVEAAARGAGGCADGGQGPAQGSVAAPLREAEPRRASWARRLLDRLRPG